MKGPMTQQDCAKSDLKPNRWLRLIWISLITGSLPAVLTVIFGKPTSHDVVIQCLCGIVYSSCIGAVCTSILPRIAGLILRLTPPVLWIVLGLLLIVMAAVGCLAASFLVVLFGVTPPQEFATQYFVSLKISIVITLIFGFTSFWNEVLSDRYLKAAAELEAHEKADEKLRQAATEARLSSLESRVQPHFLFNTLNSVLALIREEPAEAERMVERLAALLRFSLDANQSRLIPLSLEAKIIRDYLEIEQVRFGSRLRFSIEIPVSLDNLQIPPMSLQTVVENSVKYAVSSRREGATITLQARLSDGKARIEVMDDGPGFASAPSLPGHGLELLQNRVEGLFGESGSVQIGRSSAGGASVVLILPYSQLAISSPVLAEAAV